MKRLLLLFLLFPLLLFGQSRRRGIIDSIKTIATANIPDIYNVLGNAPGTRVERNTVADSGDYLTIVTRIYSPKPEVFKPLAASPIVVVHIGDITPFKTDTVHVPEFEVVPYLEPISLMAVVSIKLSDPIVRKMDTVVTLPLPDVLFGDLPVLSIKLIATTIHLPRLDTISVPIFDIKKYPVEELHLSPEGYSLLEKMEGFSPSLYALNDGGFTIGFGFFLPYAEGNKWDKGVTVEEAEVMIHQKMPAYENQVKRYINVPLTQNEFDALTMLAYNLGGFSKATSIVSDVNTMAGFDKLQSDWNRFVHSKAPNVTRGLMNRRKDEMRVRGEAFYQPDRKIIVLKNK